jgi:mono/diheme cytochrome c family protein
MNFRTLALALFAAASAGAEQVSPADAEFFERRIRPVLAEQCYECHGAEKQKGGLRLDSREAVLQGGDSGPALVAKDVERSLLIRAVRYTDKDMAMPPSKDGSRKLPRAVIADLEEWIRRGAPDPRTGASVAVERPKFDLEKARQEWAYRPPQNVAPPKVANAAWVQTPVDAFILARLEAAGLPPAAPADPRTLIRRMTFDLTGLPPTPEEVRAFEQAVAKDRTSAIKGLVERLLASPAYGERWARHWLDVVRYADSLDSRGSGNDGDILDAWRYRDWVVSALNQDLPYDQFITHQIAGDLLARHAWDPAKVVATGVFAIGNWGNGDSDKRKVYTDMVDDQVDVIGRGFLGLTLTCARCHDHKFDPISTADYYALAGFFFSSRIVEKFQPPTEGEKLMRIPLLPEAEREQRETWKQRVAQLDAELAGGLQPAKTFIPNVAGKPALVGFRPEKADNPSLVVNRSDSEAKFVTITLPARSFSLHPGPKTSAALAWQSPIAGKVRISAKIKDADANCGNGVEWRVRAAAAKLGGGTMENGSEAAFAETVATVNRGDLVQLLIRPRGEYTCDSTQVEFTIRAEDGKTWDAREFFSRTEGTLVQPMDGVWWFCEGEGEQLGVDGPHFAKLREERDALRTKLGPPPMAQGLQDGGIPGTEYAGSHDVRVHVRGRYDRLGELQPRGFPALFASARPTQIQDSGREALASWVASPQNPLTARVMANRIWAHHFGHGIVRTPNNFGSLGERPTHPELLDWLAREFIACGWSMKEVHRLILLSSAYQQASHSPAVASKDPDNRLFGRQHRRKLSAEELRDAMLAVTGKLDRTSGGPAVPDLNSGRRTLYIKTIRSDRSTYQMLFDGADPTGIVEKRTDSVIAPQALWLLNHPFALTQAAALAARAQQAAPAGGDARLAWLFETLFARPITPAEKDVLSPAIGTDESWERLCHVLLCANEFIYAD